MEILERGDKNRVKLSKIDTTEHRTWETGCLSARQKTSTFRATKEPSVRQHETTGSHWTNVYEISYLRIFLKSVEKIQASLKSDKNNGYFT